MLSGIGALYLLTPDLTLSWAIRIYYLYVEPHNRYALDFISARILWLDDQFTCSNQTKS